MEDGGETAVTPKKKKKKKKKKKAVEEGGGEGGEEVTAGNDAKEDSKGVCMCVVHRSICTVHVWVICSCMCTV